MNMNRTRLIKIILLTAVVVLFSVVASYAVNVPQLINYNGTLTDKNGVPVTGNFDMVFRIYDAPSGGNVLWSETWNSSTSKVTVVNGTYNVMIGFQNPIPATFFADHPVTLDHPGLYLGIKVGTDSEMMPRQQITSVGYAFSAGNGVPKGGIIMWNGAIADIPAGWALCDGVERTLADGSKVTPPNLRDRFIVGAGSGYAVGATGGEASHVLSIAEMPSHTHTQNEHTHIQDAHSHNRYVGVGTDESSPYYPSKSSVDKDLYTSIAGQSVTATNQNTTATNQNNGGGAAHENRPPYYALAFIMKL
jgi:microcystin-dependent protein